MNLHLFSRRSLLAAPVLAFLPRHTGVTQATSRLQYPIGWPDRTPADGFLIRHGFATENTWFNPGWWHTGEDWYTLDDAETAGAEVYAIAAGEVVYASFDYPGRVVIVQHEPDLFSMYGHLDYTLDVDEGSIVEAGDRLGTVLLRDDGAAPSHLHFEVRTFLTTPEVNGDAPRYGVNCGVDCPPGPGYWPIDAAEHPAGMGWMNPTHLIGSRSSGQGRVVVAEGASATIDLFEAPDGEPVDTIAVEQGQEFTLTGVEAGDPLSQETSAEGYRLWYEIELAAGESGWFRALAASDEDTGSDGRPSSIRFNLLPRLD
jgi:hypothetical protein